MVRIKFHEIIYLNLIKSCFRYSQCNDLKVIVGLFPPLLLAFAAIWSHYAGEVLLEDEFFRNLFIKHK